MHLRLRRMQAKVDELSQSGTSATAISLATTAQATSPVGASTAAAPVASTPATSRKRSTPEVDANSLSADPPTRAIYVSPRKTFTPVRRIKSNNIASSVPAHAAATGSQLFTPSSAVPGQSRTVSNPSALIEKGLVPGNDARSVSGLVDRTNTPRSGSHGLQANVVLGSSKRPIVPAPPATGERKAVAHSEIMKRLQGLKGAPKV